MRKFILIRDFPQLPDRSLFKEEDGAYVHKVGNKEVVLPRCAVEDNERWFKEITEEKECQG